MRRAGSYNLPQ